MTVNMGSGCSHTQPSPPPQSQKPRATRLPPHPEIHSDQALTQLPLPTVCLQSSVFFSSSRPSWSLDALPQGLCLYFSESESTHSVSCPYPGSNLGSCFPGAPPLLWVTSFLTNSTSVGCPYLTLSPHSSPRSRWKERWGVEIRTVLRSLSAPPPQSHLAQLMSSYLDPSRV